MRRAVVALGAIAIAAGVATWVLVNRSPELVVRIVAPATMREGRPWTDSARVLLVDRQALMDSLALPCVQFRQVVPGATNATAVERVADRIARRRALLADAARLTHDLATDSVTVSLAGFVTPFRLPEEAVAVLAHPDLFVGVVPLDRTSDQEQVFTLDDLGSVCDDVVEPSR